MSAKGYFAFPPSSTSRPHPAFIPQPPTTREKFVDNGAPGKGDETRSEEPPNDEERINRLHKERALIEMSEIEWVRGGGVLRDAQGRRDKARTERIRAELKLQEEEKAKLGRWKEYDELWKALVASDEALSFTDIPWPLLTAPSSKDTDVFTLPAISEFLFESLSVRTNTITKKSRIRSSILRWHPDKSSLVVSRVVAEDLDAVREGIHAVFHCLKRLQDDERDNIHTV
ncbi:hypothetical protein DEU56DRAFT_797944 [Suillus clintonianus]|uniref:uncharacterized protein n=1 Tax=Suillus clintonianus TaxID=1904413 RepID=UPI001B87D96A|nr:uncharacterized protein DEU56DRAFT_797944 [Suillus clintonianus]KAG2140650.1 hypothetical protein DEU56DRAFT_797944 [Suillus clintonianus]